MGASHNRASALRLTPAEGHVAWLSPAVLEKLVLERCPPVVSIRDMIAAADLPWSEQKEAVFG